MVNYCSLSDGPKRPNATNYHIVTYANHRDYYIISLFSLGAVCLQGGAGRYVTPFSSSSSGELLLSLSDGPAASPGSTAGESTTALVSVSVA